MNYARNARALLAAAVVLGTAAGASAQEPAPAVPPPAPSASAAPALSSAPAPAPSLAPAPSPAPARAPAPPPTAAPSSSASDEPEPTSTGWAFGLRAGFARPYGTAKAGPFTDVAAYGIVFGADIGYFLNPHLFVGGYGLFGLVTTSTAPTSTCENGPNQIPTTCSATAFRFGGLVQWHFRPEENVNPWVGAGIGMEVLNETASDETGASAGAASFFGVELLNLQAGLEYKPKPFYGFGPYVETSLAHYFGADSGTAIRGWMVFGLRLHSGI